MSLVNQDLTALGTSRTMEAAAVDYDIAGTFVGTWELQTLIDDVWHPAATGSAAAAALNVRRAVPSDWRVEVTAFTSGTIQVTMVGSNRS